MAILSSIYAQISPVKITGYTCLAWYDASDVNNNGTNPSNNTTVTTWYDKSGNGYNATTVSAPTYLTSSSAMNNKPALRFNGSQSMSASVSFSAGRTIFVVGQADTTSSSFVSWSYNISGAFYNYSLNATEIARCLGGAYVAYVNPYKTLFTANTNAHVFCAVENASRQSYVYIDGSAQDGSNGSTGNGWTGQNTVYIGYGYSGNGSSSFNWSLTGVISEIIIYNGELPATQKMQVINYLSMKWGLGSTVDTDTDGVMDSVEVDPYNSNVTSQISVGSLPPVTAQLKCWLDASRPNGDNINTATGSAISCWTDLSGNGNHATQITSARQPILFTSNIDSKLASKKALYFDGIDDEMQINIPSVLGMQNAPYEVFIVFVSTGYANASSGIQIPIGAYPYDVYEIQFNNVYGVRFRANSNDSYLGSSGDYTTNPAKSHIMSMRVGNNGYSILRIDGLDSTVSPVNSKTTNNGILNLGNRFESSYWFKGYIAEVLIYGGRELNSTERTSIETYFKNKWIDTDGDGVTDLNDAFPTDATLSSMPVHSTGNTIPRSLAGLTLWLDGSEPHGTTTTGISNAGQLDTWVDFSGNGNHAIPTLTNTKPTYDFTTITATCIINFNGSQYLSLTKPEQLALNEYTIFSVVKPADTTYRTIISNCSGNTGYILRLDPDSYWRHYIGDGSWYSNLAKIGTTSSFALVNASFSNFSGIGTLNVNRSGISGTKTQIIPSVPRIGTRFDSTGESFFGKIAEIIIYNRILSSTETKTVEDYLQTKWNITVASDTFVNDDTMSSMPVHSTGILIDNIANDEPLKLSGLALWLDGKEPHGKDAIGLTPNGTIQTWVDFSGKGNHATQTNANYRPQYVQFASSSIIRFTAGTYKSGMGTTTSIIKPYTIFLVCSDGETSTVARRVLTGDVNNNWLMGPRGGKLALFSSGWVYPNDEPVGGTPTIFYTATKNKAYLMTTTNDSNSAAFYINGAYKTTGSGYLGIPGVLYLGAGGIAPTEGFIGDMNEIIVYNRALNTAERQQIEKYLQTKWAISATLDTDGDYVNDELDAFPTDITLSSMPVHSNYTISGTITSNEPTKISGLRLWLDGSEPHGTTGGLANGARFKTWIDFSGNGNHATQENSSFQPWYNTNVFNSKSAVTFGATYSSCLNLPNNTVPSGDTPYTVIAVVNTPAATLGRAGFLGGGTGPTSLINIFRTNTTGIFENCWFGNDIQTSAGSVVATKSYIVSFTYTKGMRQIYMNHLLSASSAVSSARASTVTKNYVGCCYYFDGNSTEYYDYWNGAIAELIVYDHALTTLERQQIESYLQLKFGLPNTINTDNDSQYDQNDLFPNDITLTTMPTHSSGPLSVGTSIQNDEPLKLASGTKPLIWLDAKEPHGSFGFTSGTQLQTWIDFSGNGNHATQDPTSGNRPIWYSTATFSGTMMPFVSFDGISDYMESLFNRYSGDKLSVFVVAKRNVSPGSALITLTSANVTDDYNDLTSMVLYQANLTPIPLTVYRAGALESFVHPGNGNPFLFSVFFDGTNSYAYLNGVRSATYAKSGNFALDKLRCGSRHYGGIDTDYTKEDIAEIIVYPAVLSDTERQQIETYLQKKWNVGMDVDGDGIPDSTDAFPNDVTLSSTPVSAISLPPTFGSDAPKLWLDASQPHGGKNFSGSTVQTVVDISGNGNSFSQGLPAYQPIFTAGALNGKSVMSFSGVQQLLIERSTTANNAWTMIAVAQFTGVNGVVLLGAKDTDNAHFGISSNKFASKVGGSWQESLSSYSTSGLSGWNIVSATAKDGLTRYYINGVLIGTIQSKTTAPFGVLGNSYSGAQAFGSIAEVIMYQRALSDNERSQIERSLSTKWGLTKQNSPTSMLLNSDF
jgi:hypothetical protein